MHTYHTRLFVASDESNSSNAKLATFAFEYSISPVDKSSYVTVRTKPDGSY